MAAAEGQRRIRPSPGARSTCAEPEDLKSSDTGCEPSHHRGHARTALVAGRRGSTGRSSWCAGRRPDAPRLPVRAEPGRDSRSPSHGTPRIELRAPGRMRCTGRLEAAARGTRRPRRPPRSSGRQRPPGRRGAAYAAPGTAGGGDSVAGGRRSPAGGPASRVAAESRAARPLGTAPGGMAGMVGVVNRCRPDRREPHRTPPLFQRLRREGPRGCRATLDATQWELALHTQDAQGAAEGLRRAVRPRRRGGLGAAQGGVADRADRSSPSSSVVASGCRVACDSSGRPHERHRVAAGPPPSRGGRGLRLDAGVAGPRPHHTARQAETDGPAGAAQGGVAWELMVKRPSRKTKASCPAALVKDVGR